MDEFLCQIPLDKDTNILLDDEWLTPQEREERERQNVRATQIRNRTQPMPPLITNVPITEEPSLSPTVEALVIPSTTITSNQPRFIDTVEFPSDFPPVDEAPQSLPSHFSSPRQSTRSGLGTVTSTKYQDEVFHTDLQLSSQSHQHQILVYHAALDTDYVTGLYNGLDPRACAAGNKLNGPDQPTVHEALHGSESHHYIEAMKLEIM